MEKFADKYFKTDPWRIVETGFDPAYAEVAESVFSLGNEYTGLRGYFEEGYSGETLQGSYINGLYERRSVPQSGYKSMLPYSEFMVNTVDWVHLRLSCNGRPLNLAHSRFEQFERVLDLRTGALTRSFVWHPDENTSLRLCFERFLSMENAHLGGQKVTFEALRGSANLALTAGLDFSRLHNSTNQNYWQCSGAAAAGHTCEITGTTRQTGQQLFAACHFSGLPQGTPVHSNEEQYAGFRWALPLSAGQTAAFCRTALLVAAKTPAEMQTFPARSAAEKEALPTLAYEPLKTQSAAWWQRQWQLSDIEIEGDEENQQGIRYCIFQMHQTLHSAGHSALIGAKGLTGEAYNGNTFWDTEVYCLPFYLFNNPAAAKAILEFRHNTLPQAKQRAAALDCAGAYYPVATISGRECCDLWQHANLQLQPSTGVAYGIWLYHKRTGDDAFLYTKGAEILLEVCRMLASRGGWDAATGEYGFYGVMGPDEFQMMANHNTYTNYMAKKCFLYTLGVLQTMQEKQPAQYAALAQKTGLSGEETAAWHTMAQKMRILYNDETTLFEQHEGFFHLPHVNVASIPVEKFPLYTHWSYDRIYRNDMIKQPDVLMLMLLYNQDFTPRQLRANYDYYEPRCIHESSLSPSVHSILAAQLGCMEQAYAFFSFATRMDLDNYNRNTREGLHTTSIAGSWMNIVYGFGGLRSDGDLLQLAPAIPASWRRYSFKLLCGASVLQVEVSHTEATLTVRTGPPVELLVYGQKTTVGGEVRIALQTMEEAG